MVDGSLGGLGGCPFAPGASGNTSSEDLLFATRPGWFTPDALASMVEVTDKMLAEIGEPNRPKTAQGARSEARASLGDHGRAAPRCRLTFWSPPRCPTRVWRCCTRQEASCSPILR